MVEQQDMYIQYFRLQDLVKIDHNPKLHSPEIADSFRKYGYVDPILIDEGSQKLVAGEGRLERLEQQYTDGEKPPKRIKVDADGSWMVPVIRGVTFDSQEEAEEYGVTANALTIAGGFDEAELEQYIRETEAEPLAVEAILESEMAAMTAEVETEIGKQEEDVDLEMPEVNENDEQGAINNAVAERDERQSSDPQEEQKASEEPHEKKLDDQQVYDQLPFELKGVFELAEEAYWLPEDDDFQTNCVAATNPTQDGYWVDMPGANGIGIPNLRPDKLVEKLPDNLTIWGDRQSTPDDGKSWYFFNYGACPHRDLPFERTIFSFFTHDAHIETWWAHPAYRVGQIIRAGVKNIVVPDFSLWDISPTAAHIWSLYRSAWLGRYFQEAGLRVIPRLEFFQPKSQQYCLLGIPYQAPIVATQFQTDFEEERVPMIEKNLKAALKILKPGRLLVYAGKRGREMIEKFDLPCDLTVLKTSSEVRKREVRKKETDPHLIELRKRKRGREAERATTPKA